VYPVVRLLQGGGDEILSDPRMLTQAYLIVLSLAPPEPTHGAAQ
jgi:hypothetical protein